MTKEQFVDAINPMIDLPQAKQRLNLLYRYFGQKNVNTLKKASEKAGYVLKSFPVPAEFKEFYEMSMEDAAKPVFIPKQLNDMELCECMLNTGMEEITKGIIYLCEGDVENNLPKRFEPLRRMWGLIQDMISKDDLERLKEHCDKNIKEKEKFYA